MADSKLTRIRRMMQFGAWLLPTGPGKNSLLRALGHDVHPTARARPNLVWNVGHLSMAEGSRIGLFNLIKNMRRVELGTGAGIGRLNVVSAHPVFMRLYPSGAALQIDSGGHITSRHQLDCSGSLSIGRSALLAGHQTRVMTHSIDIRTDTQAAHPATIGERSFLGTRCLILGGATLPPRSVLAAGSVLTRSAGGDDRQGLWAGVPATYKKPVSGDWFDRAQTSTTRVLIPETGEIVDET